MFSGQQFIHCRESYKIFLTQVQYECLVMAFYLRPQKYHSGSATRPRRRPDVRGMKIVAPMTSGRCLWPQERLLLKLSNKAVTNLF